MNKKLQNLKVFAWIIIVIYLTRSNLFQLLKIDFASVEVANDLRQIWMFLIPLAVGTIIVTSGKDSESNGKTILGLILGVFGSYGLVIVLNFINTFCAWQYSPPLYIHKSKKAVIRERILDCGAYDSDPTYQLVVTEPIGTYLIKYNEIRKEAIFVKEWIKK